MSGHQSLGCDVRSVVSGRLRAATEAVLTKGLMEYLEENLREEALAQAFHDVEMPSMLTLARMELNGFGKLFNFLKNFVSVFISVIILIIQWRCLFVDLVQFLFLVMGFYIF